MLSKLTMITSTHWKPQRAAGDDRNCQRLHDDGDDDDDGVHNCDERGCYAGAKPTKCHHDTHCDTIC